MKLQREVRQCPWEDWICREGSLGPLPPSFPAFPPEPDLLEQLLSHGPQPSRDASFEKQVLF